MNRSPSPHPSRAVRLSAALLIGTAVAGLGAAPAMAQQAAGASTPRDFSIGAQPLVDAMREFSRETGIQVAYTASIGTGVASPGVSGSFTPAEALSRLLTGTGLTFRFTGPNAVTLEPAPRAAAGGSDGDAITLGPVRVQGEGSGRGGGTARPPADTRGTYTVPATSSATRMDLAIKDTPQVVHVITRQRIEDQNLTQVADVLTNAPGITVQQQGVPGAGRIQYFSRGFPVTNVMLDGVVTTGAANRDFDLWSALDTAIYDRVELVQGSTGLATGAGDPSASVNFVRKRPTEGRLAEAKVSYGSWERWRVEGDLAGPLNASGSIRGRFVGAHQQGNTWQDRVETKMSTLYGVVEADPTANIMLTAGLLWTKIRVNDAAPFGTTPAGRNDFAPQNPAFDITSLGRSFNPATQWTFTEIEMINPFAKVEWRFADDWRLNISYMYTGIKHNRLYGSIGETFYDPQGNLASYTYGRVNLKGDIHNFDAQVSGKLHLFGREHDLTMGVNGYWGASENPVYNPWGAGPKTIAISNWNNGDVPLPTLGIPSFVLNDLLTCECGYSFNEEKQLGAYAGARFRPLDRVSLIFGGRYNRWERTGRGLSLTYSSIFPLIPDPNKDFKIKVNGKFTPYAGIVVDVSKDVTAYFSYAGISKANADFEIGAWPRDVNGDPLPPISGNTFEIGAKAALFDNRLNIQFAGYRMKQKNLPYQSQTRAPIGGPGIPCFPNPLGGWCTNPQSPGNGIISEGVDFSVHGQLAPRLNLSASYSYLRMKSDEGGHIVNGEEQPDVTNPYCEAATGFNPSGGLMTDGRSFNCPKHTIKIFATYEPADRLLIGSGLTWKSGTVSSQPNVDPDAIRDARDQGSFAVVDLMARYTINRNVSLSANIYNLFDKKYLSASDNRGGFYGAPRNVMVSVGFRY